MERSRKKLLAVGLSLALSVPACARDDGFDTVRAGEYVPPVPAVRFEPLADDPAVVYGWRDLAAATSDLPANEREYSAGVLGAVAGIAEGPDRTVYVLDRAWRKIVAFDADGTYRRLILGGHGEGPGEFQIAKALAVAPNGNLAVLDEAPYRASLFSSNGDLLTIINLEGRLPLGLAVNDRQVWILRAVYYAGETAIDEYDVPSGELVATLGPVDESLAAFTSFGEPGAIVASLQADLIWALPTSGVIRRLGGDRRDTKGQRLFPEAEPFTRLSQWNEEVRSVPAGVRGVAATEEEAFILHVRRLRLSQVGQRGKLEYLLTILPLSGSSDGRHFTFGDRELWPRGFAVSHDGGAVYVASDEPYPQVQKFVLPHLE